MSRTKGAAENIPWKMEEIQILDLTPRQELCKFFKKDKKLVISQIVKTSIFGRNTLMSELRRMEELRLVSVEVKTVKLAKAIEARQMIVYTWIGGTATGESRRVSKNTRSKIGSQ